MPVRSSGARVFKWPDRETVVAALTGWVLAEAARHPELLRLGYFGSYARGDWGVGSDLDLIAVVSETREPFERRAVGWRTEDLPVPTELLVYAEAEWERLRGERSRFAETVDAETIWVWRSTRNSALDDEEPSARSEGAGPLTVAPASKRSVDR